MKSARTVPGLSTLLILTLDGCPVGFGVHSGADKASRRICADLGKNLDSGRATVEVVNARLVFTTTDRKKLEFEIDEAIAGFIRNQLARDADEDHLRIVFIEDGCGIRIFTNMSDRDRRRIDQNVVGRPV